MTATAAPAATPKKVKVPREEDPRNPNFRLQALLDPGSVELITPDDDSGMLAAVGTTAATFDPFGIDVSINGIRVCRAGEPDESRDLVDLTPRKVHVLIDLHAGSSSATVWTNDLTHDYVHENSAYAS